jgi:hypothetical protein
MFHDFLNSGVQLVNDPSLYVFDKLIESAAKRWDNADFLKASDQAVVQAYLDDIGLDYVHPDVGYSWNSCAARVCTYRDNEGKWRGKSLGYDPSYPVYISHYWNEFKPWNIQCPIFTFYKRTLGI